MTARQQGRAREVARLLDDVAAWARSRPDVVGVLLVGSYARGQARTGSDVDLVVLTEAVGEATAERGLLGLRPRARLVRTATWGPLVERRYRLGSGLVVELGLAPPSWAAQPLDPGTRRVLADGHRVLHDPHGLVARAAASLADLRR